MKWFLLLVMVIEAHSAPVCDPRKFEGQYGVQLSGTTTISGGQKPVALIGRVVFDGHGAVTGYVSVNYTGLLLGNPVNGSYEAKTDCSLTWSLQDDSGALQHFAGSMTADFLRAEFHQTDEGGAQNGIMVRTPKECSLAALQKRYNYAISGSTTPMLPGQTSGRVSTGGLVEVGDGGTLTISEASGRAAGRGTVQVGSDCIAQFDLQIPVTDTDATVPMKVRGVLLDEGKEILGIQTDPGTTVTAKFTARQ
jgi:hypothetical protein